ncbi:hypothetical protein [Paludisphaera soli]|uniref:hypothetical protein n=1 Tax=Paludisphaera soli TaxID=2712865 RepID=UPI0013EA1416|nr:hypothetical protein [Paludisphaera soli]
MRERTGDWPRRDFLTAGCVAVGVGLGGVGNAAGAEDRVRDWLRPYVVRKDSIDRFLDPRARVWARFDPQLGYLLRNSFVRDGVDGCSTLARYDESGRRRQAHFADQPCRIHTYGDSFTQGHQVSDGETWQEVLAAHFCEPIRNYGIGGFGVYQAYLRLLRHESTDEGAPYLIFNIWGDDHYRSLYTWRSLSFPPNVLESMSTVMFHANPWSHAGLDDDGALVEHPNPCPDEESLYRLCDLDFVVDRFGGDEVTHLLYARSTGEAIDADVITRASKVAGLPAPDLSGPEAVKRSAAAALHGYAVRVGVRVMERLDAFCRERGKKLMVLMSYSSSSVWHACNRTPPGDRDNVDWHPESFRAFLTSKSIPYVDTLPRHVADFAAYRLTAKQYVDRLYIGHYNPTGNHFFAFAVKDDLRRFLEPEPPAYRNDDQAPVQFDGYLPG